MTRAGGGRAERARAWRIENGRPVATFRSSSFTKGRRWIEQPTWGLLLPTKGQRGSATGFQWSDSAFGVECRPLLSTATSAIQVSKTSALRHCGPNWQKSCFGMSPGGWTIAGPADGVLASMHLNLSVLSTNVLNTRVSQTSRRTQGLLWRSLNPGHAGALAAPGRRPPTRRADGHDLVFGSAWQKH